MTPDIVSGTATEVGLGVTVRRVEYGERDGTPLTALVYRRGDAGGRHAPIHVPTSRAEPDVGTQEGVTRPSTSPRRLPVVLDAHGGAWTHFGAGVDRFWCRGLAAAGHVVVAAEFTQSGTAPWPAGLEDLRAAARWIRAGGVGPDADAAGLAVMGGSSGGHYAAMVGLLGDADGRAVDAVVALWPIGDVAGRYRMVRDRRFGPLTRVTAGLLARAMGDAAGATADGTGERLGGLDDLWLRNRHAADVVGVVLQTLNLVQARVPPLRLLLYRELSRAHEITFPDGEGQMRTASPVQLLEDAGDTELPPLLVVHARGDTNTTLAMSRRLVAGWHAAGAAARLDVVRAVGHSYGNIPSAAASALVERIAAFLGAESPQAIAGQTP